MGKAMTLRMSEDRMKELEVLCAAESWPWSKNKMLQACVAFTFQCHKKVKLDKDNNRRSLISALDIEFKTKINDLNIRW